MDNASNDRAYPPTGSVQLLYALNSVAATLQRSIESEQHIYTAFHSELIELGLRGGISELDETGQVLKFKTVAFTNPIHKILPRYVKKANLQTKGFTVRVDEVDVYQKVVNEVLSIFVPDTSTVSAQVVPHILRGLVKPILSFLGSPPGIYSPLIYEGKVKGMLNIIGPELTEADLPAVDVFTNQIAVALENARLITKLQNANEALEVTYQITMEGWVKALDLRDKETEGHTMRVAHTTEKLAEFMGISKDQIQYLRIGAFLHDIGKMSIPDRILLKPGPLTKAEWEIMHQHPQTAYSWLEAIEYLRPALAIPYCHHERWDGSGYPQGLAGESIPFAARIFAVVDTWDAMLSDRPYRKALPQKEVIAQIKTESGSHFDPQVVEAFIILIQTDPQLHNEQKNLSHT
jgi:putative nucleotidyltransferase with HDIG domain